MTKMTLNPKNMIKAYYDSHVDSAVWEAFLVMRYNGFITEKEWKKFYDTCKGWFWNFDTNTVWESTSTGEQEVKL